MNDRAIIKGGTWVPPEPTDPPEGWGGWRPVQLGLPNFERTKYAKDENKRAIWRYRGWWLWRKRDGFWGDPLQARRCLRDGYLRGAVMNGDGTITYTQDPIDKKARAWLRMMARGRK